MDIDYTHIWKDAPTRDQGGIGNCHIFTTVGLLEARYYREHYIYRALSPYDLFINHMLESVKLFKAQGFMTHPLQEFVLYSGNESLEGGNEFSNLKLIKKYGLALDDQKPYPSPGTEEMDKLLNDVRMNTYMWQHAFREQDMTEYNANVFTCEKVRKNIKNLYKNSALKGFEDDAERELYREDREHIREFAKGLKLKKTPYLGNWRGTKKERMVSYLRCNPLVLTVSNYEKLIPKDANQSLLFAKKKPGKKKNIFEESLHSVLLVGFIESTNDFLIKNSWGYQIERFDADKFSVHVKEAAYLKRGFEKTSDCTYAENPVRYQ